MTSVEVEALRSSPRPSARFQAAALSAVFAATLLLSAFLLFSVQPMFTKMVLPALGGSPGVWSVAMVFFQALLLAGYLWAHLLTRAFRLPVAVLIHLAVTLLATAALPIALSAASRTPPEGGQALWLIGVFAASVGAPFFALSANGPLLQAWFARADHPSADNPYRLYGASNLGSFGALLAYPFLIEPFVGLGGQSRLWSLGFAALLACLALCGALALRAARPGRPAATAHTATATAGWSWTDFAGWTLLAAIPSGLLVAVTAHISTDIAAAPLLWVLPLALYLLTFVIAFRDRFALRAQAIAPVLIFAALSMLTFMSLGGLSLATMLLAHLAFFFVGVLLCHRSLYERRPEKADLTTFYVAMSLGGLVGGLFAGLLAPNIFASVVEYPLLIAALLLCQPSFAAALKAARPRDFALPTAITLALLGGAWLTADTILPAQRAIAFCGAGIFVAAVLRWRSAPHVAVCVAALCATTAWLPQASSNATSWRSFFGVHKVREIVHDGARFRTLMHGTTMHGAVRIDAGGNPTPAGNPLPSTYYAPEGPIGEALASIRAHGGLPLVHAVGLGVGTLACHRRANEEIVFFEIDPEVVRIARAPSLFSFLSSCAPHARIVLGDARLTLANETSIANAIVIDAFSSDAIPVHLLTKEAFAIYLSKLAPDGAIVFHISNNTMNLSPVVARVAADFGLAAFRRVDVVKGGADANMRASSIAMALARDPQHLGAIAHSARWKRVDPDMARRPWTDDYSTIIEPILDARR